MDGFKYFLGIIFLAFVLSGCKSTLNVNLDGSGTVEISPDPDSICSNNAGLCYKYPNNTEVILSAEPSHGYHLLTWGHNACHDDRLNCTFKLSGTQTANVLFWPSPAVEPLSAGGGTLTVEDTAKVVFPAGSFNGTQTVRLERINAASHMEEFLRTTRIFKSSNPMPYAVQLNTGKIRPNTEFSVEIQLDETYLASLPGGTVPRLFVSFLQDQGAGIIDAFEWVDATFAAGANNFSTILPAAVLTNRRTLDESYQVVFMVAATPVDVPQANMTATPDSAFGDTPVSIQLLSEMPHYVAGQLSMPPSPDRAAGIMQRFQSVTAITPNNRVEVPSPQTQYRTMAANACPAVNLTSPLTDHRNLVSPFQVWRQHSVAYQTSPGETVLAMRDGIVIAAGHDDRTLPDTRVNTGDARKGWGTYLLIEDTAGHVLLYGRLQPESLTKAEGETVSAGEIIALASGEPLHIAYAPAGAGKINPDACISQPQQGSLTCVPLELDQVNLQAQIGGISDLGCHLLSVTERVKISAVIDDFAPADFDLELYRWYQSEGTVALLGRTNNRDTFGEIITTVVDPGDYLMITVPVALGNQATPIQYTAAIAGWGGDFDQYEPNDTPEMATPISGGDHLKGNFDSAIDADWFRYEFNALYSTIRLHFRGDNGKLTAYIGGQVYNIPSGNAITVEGDIGEGFYFTVEQTSMSLTTNAVPFSGLGNWEISITGIPDRITQFYYGSNESLTGLVSHRPQVHRKLTVSGFVLDSTGRVVPNANVFSLPGIPEIAGQATLTGASGNFVVNYELPRCQNGESVELRRGRNFPNPDRWEIEWNDAILRVQLAEAPEFFMLLPYHHVCRETFLGN